MTICTHNASEAIIEDLIMQAKKIRYEEEEEVEAFYMDLEKFYREDHDFCKVIIGDFNAKVGPKPLRVHHDH
ncbi:hypothetical protein RB195_019319 [Necator americanus]|uniref:Craniofacial development protein 2-like n=1 Tax=Necator americanus TaxID=51031 RepID=A0ABR1CDN4_NECAM